jgi:hypothetical protein
LKKEKRCKPKGILNIFNKMITENFQNLEKVLLIQIQEASRTPNRLDQNRTSPRHIIIKTRSTENIERILKAAREKQQHIKENPSKSQQISQWTLKSRRAWSEAFQALNENNFNAKILYPAKLSFKIDEATKIFHNKQKPKHYMTTKSSLQKILQGILDAESESKQNHNRKESIKPQKKKRQAIKE